MMQKTTSPKVALLLALLALVLVACQASPQVDQQNWEYKTLLIENIDWGPFGFSSCSNPTCFAEDGDAATLERLNTLGSEGWELVGIAHNAQEIGAVLIFKRPLR